MPLFGKKSFGWKEPQDDARMAWTQHAKIKMRHYGLSESRIKRVLRNPKRTEEGIAQGTVAIMQPASPTSKQQTEIWVMYQVLGSERKMKNTKLPRPTRKIRIITAWRYPGVSPVRQPPPIPEDILKEIHQLL